MNMPSVFAPDLDSIPVILLRSIGLLVRRKASIMPSGKYFAKGYFLETSFADKGWTIKANRVKLSP